MAMQRLDLTAARVLHEILDRQPLTDAKVGFAWQVAAGPALARAGAVTSLSKGTLCVRAKTETWLQEIRRARPMITERIRQMLGPDVVKTIVVTCDEQDASRSRRPAGPSRT